MSYNLWYTVFSCVDNLQYTRPFLFCCFSQMLMIHIPLSIDMHAVWEPKNHADLIFQLVFLCVCVLRFGVFFRVVLCSLKVQIFLLTKIYQLLRLEENLYWQLFIHGAAQVLSKKWSFFKRYIHINSERTSDWPNQVHLQIFLSWRYTLRGTEVCVYYCGYHDERTVAYWLEFLLAISESPKSKQKGQLIYAHLISLLCKATAKIQ